MTTDWGIAQWIVRVNPYLQTVLDKGAELEYMLTPRDAKRLDYLLDRWLWRPASEMSKKQRKGLPPFRPLVKVNPPENLLAVSEFLSHLTGKEPIRILQVNMAQSVIANTERWHSAPNEMLGQTTVYQYEILPNALTDKPVPGPNSSTPSVSDRIRAEMMVARCYILVAADRILNGELERLEKLIEDQMRQYNAAYRLDAEADSPAAVVEHEQVDEKQESEDPSGPNG